MKARGKEKMKLDRKRNRSWIMSAFAMDYLHPKKRRGEMMKGFKKGTVTLSAVVQGIPPQRRLY